MINARGLFGDIDIYLFDQILKNRFGDKMSVLDAGCGAGRNLVYFLGQGLEVFAADENPDAIEQVRIMAAALAPGLPQENFKVARIEEMPFPDERFDAVISSAVLHFARDSDHFRKMLFEMWRVLKPEGLFFARLASSIGIEDRIEPAGAGGSSGRFLLPDGSERFLVDEEILTGATEQLGAVWLEPLKTTNVQNLRCMTTWVLRKSAG
jgi:SAM-dependent methyltransferase